jgi:hypothetical protein
MKNKKQAWPRSIKRELEMAISAVKCDFQHFLCPFMPGMADRAKRSPFRCAADSICLSSSPCTLSFCERRRARSSRTVRRFRKDLAHALMGFIDKPGNLVIDLGGFGFAVVFSGEKLSGRNIAWRGRS